VLKRKIRASYALLASFPFLQLFLNRKVYWACHILLLFVLLVEEKGLIKDRNYLYSFLLGIPLIWASLFSLNGSLSLIIQSLFYLTTPLVFTFLGMQIARVTNSKLVLKYLVYSGTIGALYYVILSLYSSGFEVFLDPYAMRGTVLWGSITNVMAIFIVGFSKKYALNVVNNRINKILIIIINSVALYLTASRTYYIVFFIFLFVFITGYNKKTILPVGAIYLLAVGVVMSSDIDNLLINRIKSIGMETEMGDYYSDAEINARYRGFENYMALQTYRGGTPINVALGYGLEKQIDLQAYVKLGESYWRIIPVLHNGYIYLLIKEGLLGLIFYSIFFIILIKLKCREHVLRFTRLVIIASVISLLATNTAIGTFFSTEMSILWVLFGVFIIHANDRRKWNASGAKPSIIINAYTR
jgi:hypothetical protein